VLKQILSYVGWSSVDHVVRLSVGLIVGIATAQYLGPEKFGLLSLLLSTVAIASCLVPLAANSIVIRELINRPGSQMEILGSQFALRTAGVFIAALLAIGAIVLQRPHLQGVWFLALLGGVSIVFLAFEPIVVWFNTHLLARASLLARLPSLLVVSLLRLVLIRFEAPLYAFIACVALEGGLAALGLMLAYRCLGQSVFKWKARGYEAKRLFGDSWPLIISGVSSLLYLRLDVLMLGAMAGDFEVGIYSAATRISEAWYFIPMIIASGVQPLILRLHISDNAQYSQRLGQLYALMAWSSVSIAVLVSFIGPIIISLLFGSAYAAAAPVLIVHIWAGVPVFLGVASSQFLTAENLARISLYRTGLGLLANVLLNFVLIPRFGALGAALATVISYTIATFSLLLFRKSRHQVWKMIAAFTPSAALNAAAALQLQVRKNAE
jgi:polysaccharide transporter, PST family